MSYRIDNRYYPIDPRYNSGYEDGRKASKGKIKDLELANAEYRDTIAQQAERIKELEAELERERLRLAACGSAALGYFDGCKDEYKSASLDDVLRLREQLTTLRQRIADAPVVAWLHEVRRDSDVITDQVKHLWGRVPVAVGKEARYTIPLISKEDLQK